jgi:hypothetical protein
VPSQAWTSARRPGAVVAGLTPRQFGRPAFGPDLLARRQEHLHARIGCNDRPDVPALRNDSPRSRGVGDDRPLLGDQPSADLGNRGDQAHDVRHPAVPDLPRHVDPVDAHVLVRGIGADLDRQAERVLGHRARVSQVHLMLKHPPRHRAVHRTGIEVAQAKRGRSAARRT